MTRFMQRVIKPVSRVVALAALTSVQTLFLPVAFMVAMTRQAMAAACTPNQIAGGCHTTHSVAGNTGCISASGSNCRVPEMPTILVPLFCAGLGIVAMRVRRRFVPDNESDQ